MSSLALSLMVLIWFALAYRFYGRFIERTLVKPDPAAVTPANQFNDGLDFSPGKKMFLWGNHFASIAGAGPIIGPIVAVSFFGWGPTLLWVALGAVFMGAVHDYMSLIISVRHKGQGIGALAVSAVGRLAANLFAIMLLVVLILIIAVFMVSVANAFVSMPALVIPTFGLVAVGLLLGLALERWHVPVWLAAPLAVALAYSLIWVGYEIPIALPAAWGREAILAFWLTALAAYCLLASVAPMWLLLRPRDFICGVQLGVGMLLGFAAIAIVQPMVNAPFAEGVSAGVTRPLWPILFILVACGAISGFHSIVSTGTTARQLDNERDARGVAFGGMLMEGALSLLVIMVVAAGLKWGFAPEGAAPAVANHYFGTALKRGWIVAFGTGFGNVAGHMGLPWLTAAGATLLGATMVKSFIMTTLDTGTRLARFLVNETVGHEAPSLNGRWLATLVVLAPAFVLALTNTYTQVWKLFGATNQLIAAVALLTITSYLARQRLPLRYTLLPALFMLATTTAALLWEMFNPETGYFMSGGGQWMLGAIAAMLVALEMVVLWKFWRSLRSGALTPARAQAAPSPDRG